MKKKLTENGISTTLAPGEENYEEFTPCGACSPLHGTVQSYFQYDYRHTDGDLFATVQSTLEKCRGQRDRWLEKKKLSKR